MARSSAPSPSAEQRRWEVAEALDTLTRAEKIKTDSKMMGEVKRLAAERQKELSKVTSKPTTTKVKR